MQYRALGKTNFRVSTLGLGGHEFHPDGRLKGFSDDFQAAIRPGYVNPELPAPQRRQLVERALEAGINYFDVTMDPEVSALGITLPPDADVLIQCRPQAMCYRYDPGNKSLADLSRLLPEVERLMRLTGRSSIGTLNFGIESAALADASYLDKIARNILRLKDAKLIRLAACDSIWSGSAHYLRLMRSGCFDIVWLNFGPLCPFAARDIFPVAAELGMGVAVREAFTKGNLFKVAEVAGLRVSRATMAAAAIRWILGHCQISTLILGMRNIGELNANLTAALTPFSSEDAVLLDRLRAQPSFAAALVEQESIYRQGQK